MRHYAWNAEKNAQLKKVRGVSFEEVVFHIEASDNEIFLKTIIPSRKATKEYLGG